MAIPSQQIGWSQKSKLLWYISKELERLTGVMGKNIPPPTTTTTTTTAAPVHYNRSSTGLLIDNSCDNWQNNRSAVNSVVLIGGDFCAATSFTTSSVISNGNYWISNGSYSRRFSAAGGVFTFTSSCAACA